jgi:para-aminobenzoate synthetase
MRTLLIDNHDSFTHNLFHLLAVTNGSEPVVVASADFHAGGSAQRQVIS